MDSVAANRRLKDMDAMIKKWGATVIRNESPQNKLWTVTILVPMVLLFAVVTGKTAKLSTILATSAGYSLSMASAPVEAFCVAKSSDAAKAMKSLISSAHLPQG